MDPIIGIRTRLYPHFRTGDFAFDLRQAPPRLKRYVGSVALAAREGRAPFARGLLVSTSGLAWWRQLPSAKAFDWNTSWLDHEGVHDGRALRHFETEVNTRLSAAHAVVIWVPTAARGRAAFRTMKSMADAAFGGVNGVVHFAWWLF